MKKFLATLLTSAMLTTILVLSQFQTKAGTIAASSIQVAQESIPVQTAAVPAYSYWVLVNPGYALVIITQ